MIFNRTYRFSSSLDMDGIKKNLVGNHVDVHKLDFEVIEKDSMLKIIPHAEEEEKLRILPITHLEINSNGRGSKLKMTAKPRRIDIGGPYLLIIFCAFCILCSLFMYFTGKLSLWYSTVVGAVGVLIFAIFWLKMETGYFDYVRKLKTFVKNKI